VEHRKAKRARGLCAAEGCRKVTGDRYRCDECAEKHKAACKAAYWAKREELMRKAAS